MKLKNEVIIAAVFLFLAVLFVFQFQPIITGHVVLDPNKVSLEDYPFPFVKNNFYNDVYIVLGRKHDSAETFAANDIAYGLKGLRGVLPPVVLETDVPANAHNLILVGTPCSNTMVANFLGSDDCSNFKDAGVVILDSKDRSASLLVSGRTSEDVRRAALFVRYIDLYAPLGNIAFVHGSIENPNGLMVEYKN